MDYVGQILDSINVPDNIKLECKLRASRTRPQCLFLWLSLMQWRYVFRIFCVIFVEKNDLSRRYFCLLIFSTFHSLSLETIPSTMSEQPDTPLGVKMLADHLVKVKMQYEGIFWFGAL